MSGPRTDQRVELSTGSGIVPGPIVQDLSMTKITKDQEILLLKPNPAPLRKLLEHMRPTLHLPWTKDIMVRQDKKIVVQIFVDDDN